MGVEIKEVSYGKSYAAKVLDFAIKRGNIQTNPYVPVDLPATASKEAIGADEDEAENFYTREQLIEFLSSLERDRNHKAYALFRLLAFSGMRKGEALALTWNDLNFTTNELRINKALSRGKDKKYEHSSSYWQ